MYTSVTPKSHNLEIKYPHPDPEDLDNHVGPARQWLRNLAEPKLRQHHC